MPTHHKVRLATYVSPSTAETFEREAARLALSSSALLATLIEQWAPPSVQSSPCSSAPRTFLAVAAAGLMLTACVTWDELDAAGELMAQWNAQQSVGVQETDYAMACYQLGTCGNGPAPVANSGTSGRGCPYAYSDGTYNKPNATACPQ